MILKRCLFFFIGLAPLVLWGCGTPSERITGAHLDLLCSSRDSRAESMQAAADLFVEEVSSYLKLRPPAKKLEVMVFQSGWAMRSYLGEHCPSKKNNGAACFETPNGYIIAVSRVWPEEETQRFLRHELAHYVLASYFYDMPPWVDEGLAQYFEAGKPFGSVNLQCAKVLKRSASRMEDGVLEELVALPAGENLTELQYARSWGLVFFLLNSDQIGRERLIHYLRVVRGGSDSRKYFRESFEVWPSVMEGSWQAWIHTLPWE